MDFKTHFKKSMEHHNALAEECAKEGLDGCAKVHRERAMHYKAMHDDAANKAALDEIAKNRAALEPTAVSAVAPDNRMVPRAGGPPIQKPNVPEEFAELVKIADDRE